MIYSTDRITDGTRTRPQAALLFVHTASPLFPHVYGTRVYGTPRPLCSRMRVAQADLIKARLEQNAVVQIKMSWSIPAPDDRVEWELWSTPTETRDDYFESNFEHEVAAMGESAYFSPHYYIYDGVASQCHGSGACGNLCTNNGLYCAMDPDGQLDEGASGADVVVESLRRLCIWQHYGAEDGIGKKWWAYTTAFIGGCNDNDFPTVADTTCADKVMKDAKIDAAVVNQCMSDSGGYEQDRTNTLLAQEVSYKDELGVIIVPAIYVNNVMQVRRERGG